jgi:hypothetical protein
MTGEGDMTESRESIELRKPGFGLSDLGRVELSPEHAERLRGAVVESLGRPEWRARKQAETRDVLALAQISERLTVLALDARVDLMIILRLRGPVPCLPPGAADTVLAGESDLLFRYPEQLMHEPIPGYDMVRILRPRHVYLPNASSQDKQPGEPQALCLGANIPRGLPLREAVLASYAAFTLQAVTLDEADPAGVMNRDAVEHWQLNSQRIPLSREAFLSPRIGSTP